MKKIISLSGMMMCVAAMGFAMPQNIEKAVDANRSRDLFSLIKETKAQKTAEQSAPARGMETTEILTDVEGKRSLYYKSAKGLYSNGAYVYAYENDDMMNEVVFSEDGTQVYFNNVLTRSNLNTYLKGTLDGNSIVVDLPQTLAWFNYGADSYGVNLCVLSYDVDDSGNVVTEIQSDITSVKFMMNPARGTIALKLPGEAGQYMLGLVYSDDCQWTGFGDFSQEYRPSNIELLSMPVDVEPQTYCYISGSYGYHVDVAFSEGNMYMRGLCEDITLGVIKGEYDASTGIATFPQDQVIGLYDVYDGTSTIMTKVVYPDPDKRLVLAPADVTYKLQVDEENLTITPVKASPWEDESILCFNAASDRVLYLQLLRDFKLQVQERYAGVPLNPFGLLYETELFEYTGYNSFYFSVPFVSTDGDLLNIEDLYYRTYMDGELMEFLDDSDSGEYKGIEELTTEIPVTFNNLNDLFHNEGSQEREVGIYIEGFETLGVQMVYRYEEEETYSDVLTLNINTGEVTIGQPESLVISIEESSSGSIRCYDMQGRLILDTIDPSALNRLDKGLYIINGKKVSIN